MPVSGTNLNFYRSGTGDIDISTQVLTLPTYFAKMLEPYRKADADLFELWEKLSWDGAGKAPQTKGLMGSIVPGKDGLHRVSKRGRLFIPLEITDLVISGTPSTTSTYTITGTQNYNSGGTESMGWVGQTIDFPNSTGGLPIRGTITVKNTGVNNAHVITVRPITGQTLPSVTAGTLVPIGTYSAETGATPSFFTPVRNETEWYNCFQNILNGTEYTDQAAYYANQLEVDLSANPELALLLYPDGKIPDSRHYMYAYVLDWLRLHLKHVKDAVWFGQFEQRTVGSERNDKMEGLIPAIRNGGQNYTYISGTNTTAVMTQLSLDLDATMLNVTEYLLYPGNEMRATLASDFIQYTDTAAIRYDFFDMGTEQNPMSVAQEFAFKPLTWNGYTFFICEKFTPFYDPSIYGSAGFNMQGDAIGLPIGYAQKANQEYAQNFSILYATDGGEGTHNLVDMRKSKGVIRNRLVQTSRDMNNTHTQKTQFSMDSWLTTRLLNDEASFYLRRV